MSVDAGTTPELLSVATDSIYAELREKIVSGEVKLNFSYLPPREIDPPIIIDAMRSPLIGGATDAALTEDELLGEIDELLDELVSGGDRTNLPLTAQSKPPERIIYL